MPLITVAIKLFNTFRVEVVKTDGGGKGAGKEAGCRQRRSGTGTGLQQGGGHGGGDVALRSFSSYSSFMPRIAKVFFIALSISLAFLVGIYFGGHYYRMSPLIGLLPESLTSAFFPGDNLLQLEREIEGILEENFYQPVDRSTLENGALEGMVNSLNDPYTAYLSPGDFQRYRDHANGTFVGVGVVMEPKADRLTVVSTVENSPANAAGIESGDVILTIDGEPVGNRTPEEAAARIRGEEGTTVVLGIRRGGSDLEFSLVRREIELPIVIDRMIEHNGRKIGYVRLEQFSMDVGARVKGSVDRLVKDGAEGIVFDLRDNGGGILDEAVNVSSVFIQNGTIVSVVGKDDDRSEYPARGDANENIPLVVLINGYSASASEIVAGAIKDDGRGQLVGEKTFGKGVVQMIFPLTNDGAIKFTSGVYYTPDGININEVGIEPDVPAADDVATDEDEVLQRGLSVLAP